MSLPRRNRFALSLILLALASLPGCYSTSHESGGGHADFQGTRRVDPDDIWLPPGYHIEPVISGLTFPTGVTFDDKGRVYVVESGYSWGHVKTKPRLLRILQNDDVDVIARGDNGPWDGVTFHDGYFYVAEGGAEKGGRILKISTDGAVTVLVKDLPSLGDHNTNGPVVGADGYVYFGQGTATNSGIVGLDNYQAGWLKAHPDFHDIPGQDITLTGVNYSTHDPLNRRQLRWYQTLLPFLAPSQLVLTGAYSPFGMPTRAGQVVRGQVPCTGAIMRVPTDGGKVELVAWGLRNPFGLAFSPDGKLFATENEFDVRGSRPVWGTGDLLWEIHQGAWYGWPDYFAGVPIDNGDRFAAPRRSVPRRLLASQPGVVPRPVAKFGVHSSADGFDFCKAQAFAHIGDAFVAEFGDLAPLTGQVAAPVGFRLVRVEMQGGVIHPFAINRGKEDAPASRLHSGGLERPIAARFNPSGDSLYVVDFGVVLTDRYGGVYPIENTGVVWRITRQEAR